jgi:hypothetical protein
MLHVGVARGGAPHAAGWGSCPTYRRRRAPDTPLSSSLPVERSSERAAVFDGWKTKAREKTIVGKKGPIAPAGPRPQVDIAPNSQSNIQPTLATLCSPVASSVVVLTKSLPHARASPAAPDTLAAKRCSLSHYRTPARAPPRPTP